MRKKSILFAQISISKAISYFFHRLHSEYPPKHHHQVMENFYNDSGPSPGTGNRRADVVTNTPGLLHMCGCIRRTPSHFCTRTTLGTAQCTPLARYCCDTMAAHKSCHKWLAQSRRNNGRRSRGQLASAQLLQMGREL